MENLYDPWENTVLWFQEEKKDRFSIWAVKNGHRTISVEYYIFFRSYEESFNISIIISVCISVHQYIFYPKKSRAGLYVGLCGEKNYQ